MGKKKAPDPKLPTASQLAPLIDLQAQYNRVGVQTPFGSQRYDVGPDGRSSTLVTDIGPEGRALVGRAVGLGMTDSARMGVPGGMNDLAAALANRVGSRFGVQAGQGMQLAQSGPNAPQKPMPQASVPNPSQSLPQMPPQAPVNPYRDPASNVIGGGSFNRQPIGRGGGMRMNDAVSRIRQEYR